MKKIIALILCLMILCVPIVASAEGGEVTEGEVSGDISTPEVETPTEGEILPPETMPEETPEETPPVETPPAETPPVETPPTETTPTFEEEVEMVSEQIKEWIVANLDSISIIITLISTCIVTFVKLKTTIKAARTMNNNTITISKASNDAIAQALASIENASGAVTNYDARIATLLEAFKTTAEDKLKLEAELVEIKNYLKTSSKSNLEFADELAELLALANIPNYKKEEIGARHVAAKREIIDAEAKAQLPTTTEEVKENVGEEA